MTAGRGRMDIGIRMKLKITGVAAVRISAPRQILRFEGFMCG